MTEAHHRIHYRPSGRGEVAACGRKVVPNWLTRDTDQVTCADCTRSDAYRDASHQPRLFPGP